MRTSEPALAERADTYGPARRGDGAQRAAPRVAGDVWIALALIVGPLAFVASSLSPELRSTSVAAALLALLVGGLVLGALPAVENSALRRRRRIALAVVVVALASMFLIVRTTG